MIKLTCLLKRREGMTPAEFHAYWRNNHGPLIANGKTGTHVIRYEQNPRPLERLPRRRRPLRATTG